MLAGLMINCIVNSESINAHSDNVEINSELD